MQYEDLINTEEETVKLCLEENPLKETHDKEIFQTGYTPSEEPIFSSEENDPSKLSEGSISSSEESNSSKHSEGSIPSSEESNSSKHNDKSHRQYFDKFLADLSLRNEPDDKLQFAIEFMEIALSQTGTPHFKSFWEARTVCLELFKEAVSPTLRSTLWIKYNELSKEARRLKEILDEQSAFAVEQIEMAIKALEDDIVSFSDHLQKLAPVEFFVSSKLMTKQLSYYQQLQNELNLLNTQASRINGLRKELIRTEMRVRQKNKFFQRLSAAGDKVFPRRKDLIKDVSHNFITDVDAFINEYFSKDDNHESLFFLREEIKALQNMAKILTLNTHSFTHTRMRLSDCWDRIKGEEKERKKERAQQKVIYKQNVDDAMQKLRMFNEAFQANQITINEANKQLDEMSTYMRGMELGRDEQRFLREELNNARRCVSDKIQAAENERNQHEHEKERVRREEIKNIKSNIEKLLKSNDSQDVEALISEREAIQEKINSILLSKAEKIDIERQLKPLRDLITEKKESSILSLSDDDRQSLLQLKEILKQRKERRQEIKNQIETLRKASGASGLDFVQAMSNNAQLAEEKERLEKISQGIKEIEQKIAELSR
jgi:DNA repair exonuclease SbcCD ATPase subunit